MGIPTAQICTITSLDAVAEKKLRRSLVLKALQAISQPAPGPGHP